MFRVFIRLEENGKDLGSHYIGMEEESIARELFDLISDLLKVCYEHYKKK